MTNDELCKKVEKTMLERKGLFQLKDDFKFEEKLRKNFKIHPEEKVFFRDNSPINRLKN
jgi:hypothetical protein